MICSQFNILFYNQQASVACFIVFKTTKKLYLTAQILNTYKKKLVKEVDVFGSLTNFCIYLRPEEATCNQMTQILTSISNLKKLYRGELAQISDDQSIF